LNQYSSWSLKKEYVTLN